MSDSTDKPIQRSLIREDKLDLRVLVEVLKSGRKRIIATTLVFTLITVLVVLLLPNKYATEAVILPQVDAASKLDRLGGLASLAGVNLTGMMGEASEISPEVYPTIVYSYPFIKDLIYTPYSFEGLSEPATYWDKMVAHPTNSLGTTILKYTIRLPWTILDSFKSSNDELGSFVTNDSLIYVSKKEAKIMKEVRSLINIDVNSKTGLVNLRVESKEPLLSAQMGRKAVNLLQEYIINHQTKQVKNNLIFVETQLEEKRQDLAEAQKKFYSFLDANRNRVTERTDLQNRELTETYNLALQLYQSLSEQLEQAKITVKKRTPAFSVIEPVKVPSEKSSPRRSMIVIIGLFLGLLIGTIGVIGKSIYLSIVDSWSSKDEE